MNADHTPRTTPLTGRADRHDERVRLIEEAVLLMRGDWPAIAMGICERVNRSAGLIVADPRELDEAIRESCVESMLLVERLYGREGVVLVERAALAAKPVPVAQSSPARRRPHIPRPHRRLRVRPG